MERRFYDPSLCSSDCPGGANQSERMARVEEQYRGITHSLERIEKRMVSRDEFTPVQRLVYGATGLALIAVAGAILSLVVNR